MVSSYVNRKAEAAILKWLKPQRVVLLKGARRTGKTQLARKIQERFKGKTEFMNAEDLDVQNLLASQTIRNYRNLFSGTDLLIIDEAQVIRDIGSKIKLIVDEVEKIRVLVTGSSSLTLTESTGEPLTGRKVDIDLYPFSISEIHEFQSGVEIRKNIDQRLLYGSYPEIFRLSSDADKKTYLAEIVRSYLLKDVLMLNSLRETAKLKKLLQLLAYQIGQEVSGHELGNLLGMSKNTVERYLYLLADASVIFPLSGFSKNLRKEVVKSKKWYFYDNGIRNAVISEFKPLELRPDTGVLWENFVVTERLKKHRSDMKTTELYFWRTYDKQEIDLIEKDGGDIRAFEMKWPKKGKKIKPPGGFVRAYKDAPFEVINRENVFDYL